MIHPAAKAVKVGTQNLAGTAHGHARGAFWIAQNRAASLNVSLRISRLTSYGCFGVQKGEKIKVQVCATRGDLAMANPTDIESAGDGAKDGAKRVSRRAFIKGVLGSGIAASS